MTDEHFPRHDFISPAPDQIAEFKRAIESMILVAHDPVAPELLAQLLEQPTTLIEQWCEELAESYLVAQHGFELRRVAGGFRYQTADDLTPYVERFLLHDQRARLSGAALETLAIVAYKQPISRAQVGAIRGVDPDGVLRTLQARGYVDEIGRDDGPGQAILYGTTEVFLEKLGLDSLDDLPPIAEFIPSADVVELLENGLRVTPEIDVAPQRVTHDDSRVEHSARHVSAGTPGADDATAADTTTGGLEPPLWEQLAEQSSALPQGERLQKVLAATGWGSRRVCEELIAQGRVTVNGDVAVLGRRVDAEHDLVEVDGAPVGVRPGLVYYLLNKPVGVVTTSKDTHGRPTVVELVPAEPRVFSVGRLDADTEGLLLLTNDGDLANRIAHPSHGVDKEYLVEVGGGRVSPGALRALREGIDLDDGRTAPATASGNRNPVSSG